MINCVGIIITIHVPLIEEEKNYPLDIFLSYFLKYTIQLKSPEDFMNSIEVWQNFIQFLTSEKTNSEKITACKRYGDLLSRLFGELYKRISFVSLGDKYFSSLNNTKINGDNQTDLGAYISQNIVNLSSICELFPKDCLKVINHKFEETLKLFVKENNMSTSQDLVTALDIYSSVAVLINEGHSNISIEDITSAILQVAKVGIQNKLFKENLHQKLISKCFDTLNCFIPSFKDDIQKKAQIVNNILNFTEIITKEHVPEKILSSYFYLFYELCSNLKTIMFEFKSFHFICQNFMKWDFEITILTNIVKGIHICILPGTKATETDISRYQSFMKAITTPFLSILQDKSFVSQHQAHTKELSKILFMINDIFESNLTIPQKSKELIFETTKNVLITIPELFKLYINTPLMLFALLKITLSSLNTLKAQVGLQYFEILIKLFLEIFGKETLGNIIKSEKGQLILLSFIELLRLTSIDPTDRFESLIPKILQVLKEIIYPIVKNHPKETLFLLTPFYQLLYDLLFTRWRKFFLLKIQENGHHLAFILECFLNSFKLKDPQIINENLKHFEELNSKVKLCQKPFFIQGMSFSFLQVFFNDLIFQLNDPLKRDFSIAIYDIAKADWANFQKFIISFLNETKLSNDQKLKLSKIFQTTPSKNEAEFQFYLDEFLNDFNFSLKN